MEPELSPGQRQAQTVGKDILSRWKPDLLKESESSAYDSFLKRIANDEIIINDVHTGQAILDHSLSRSYLEWLNYGSDGVVNEIAKGNMDRLRFDRIIVKGNTAAYKDNRPVKVYQGGSWKPYTTARAALTFIAGKPMYWGPFGEQITGSYYVRSGTLRVINGRHRCLANKLIGSKEFPLDHIDFYDEPMFDEELNRELIELEKFLPQNIGIALCDPFQVLAEVIKIKNWFQNNPGFAQAMYHYLSEKNSYSRDLSLVEIVRIKEFHSAYLLFTAYQRMSQVRRYFVSLQNWQRYRGQPILIQRLAVWIQSNGSLKHQASA